MVDSKFYDRYHRQNAGSAKVISDNNFTYFYILQRLQQVCTDWTNKKVLDVGCGVGTVLTYLASKGAKGQGVDISRRAIRLAKKSSDRLKNVFYRQGEIRSKEKDGPFDLIICSEVIEHVPGQDKLLAKIRSNLKPNGRLLLTTPSKDNLLYKMGFYQQFDKQVGHLRRYTSTSIKRTLAKNGFAVEAIYEVEGPLRNLLFTTKLSLLIKLVKGPLVSIFHKVDKVLVLIFGASDIQVIARKLKKRSK